MSNEVKQQFRTIFKENRASRKTIYLAIGLNMYDCFSDI